MIEFLKESYRLFAICILLVLGIGGVLITRGKFDYWGRRLFQERRRRFIAALLKKQKELTKRASLRLKRNNLPITPTKKYNDHTFS